MCLPFITFFTIRPLIFIILLKKRDNMSTDIRWGYIINQIAMIIQEFNFCFLFRIHDLAPYSGLYCDGPICRMGIDKQYLMTALAFTTISTIPTFLYLLLRMHQRIIENTDSRFKLSVRSQAVLFTVMVLILASNVVGFRFFAKDATDAAELIKLPDLVWLTERGGTIFMFGPPGRSEYFRFELWNLLASMIIIGPFVAIATFHSILIMFSQKDCIQLKTTTHGILVRIARVFFLQLVGVNCFFIAPLFMMLSHMVLDLSWIDARLISLTRCSLIIPFALESTQLSLIFLLKN
ncbi:hypothetical protein PFISCL1PPCAC_13110, partial [Pristionchus fissidentatus]